MQKMRRSSTAPEMLIRREMHGRGLRFRVNYRLLPGRPDLAFTSARIAVFVDGCFWHACPDHGEWWHEELERNVARDMEKDGQLDKLGWLVMHVWEHEDPVSVAEAIDQLWRSRRRTAAPRSSPGGFCAALRPAAATNGLDHRSACRYFGQKAG
jgi:DNA mismatch endonuclease (patch repair protein)